MKKSYEHEDFTFGRYSEYLNSLAEKRTFCDFDSFETDTVFLRHDVDVSPQRALLMAKLEHEKNIKATYFFQFSSIFYNLLEKDHIKILHLIKSLGHNIALHFEPFETKAKNLKMLAAEKNLLESISESEVRCFSWHNPNDDILNMLPEENLCGMFNIYSLLKQEDINYISDSNGYWRFKDMNKVIDENHSRMHVLIHPVWWQDEVMTPYDRILRSTKGRALNTEEQYCQLLKGANRENIKL